MGPAEGDVVEGDAVYSTVAAFAAGLVARGVSDVVISPGSRSTPLTLTLDAQPRLRTWVLLDERSAGFFALGMARATGRPAVLVCTSGTAAANYLPAVVEAYHAGVPMVVCTADRPPELRGWGAGQTIDQVGIFGAATRWAVDLPVAGEWTPAGAERTAMRAVATASGLQPGPVHLNWPFREPLEPIGDVPVVAVAESVGASRAVADGGRPESLIPGLTTHERGVIVVGPHDAIGVEGEHARAGAIRRFAATVGWPIIGEPLTQVRRSGAAGLVITTAGRLLVDDEFAATMAPDVVIRVGRSPTTKSVRRWLEHHRPERVVLVDPAEHWNDPSFTVTDHVATDLEHALSGEVVTRTTSPWLEQWTTAEVAARHALDAAIADGPFGSAAVAQTIAAATPSDGVVVVSNSMPVRDLDDYVPVGPAVPTVVGNRGASGIDGITSTALGVAAVHGGAVVAHMGDLAVLHDVGALLAAERLGLHLTIVCVDNDGGAIFAMLPIATRDVDLETLFLTPHGIDLASLHGTGGIRAVRIGSAANLDQAIRATTSERRPGIDLLVVAVDRDDDLAQRRALGMVVSAAASR